MVGCLPGDDIVTNACNFTCNTDLYELTGSAIKTCQSNGSWSDSDAMCESE